VAAIAEPQGVADDLEGALDGLQVVGDELGRGVGGQAETRASRTSAKSAV
jgi:hypothetical protein